MPTNPDRTRLEPESHALLQLLRRRDAALTEATTAEDKRKVFAAFDLGADPPWVPVNRVSTLEIDAGTHRIPGRLYHPAPDDLAPCLLWFHGGGHYAGDLESHDRECRIMAASSGCAVLNVAYRLAPEHRFPRAFEDAVTAVRWVASQGGDRTLKADAVFVGGASAGGNLAAAASQALSREPGPRIAHQFLVYPTLDATLDHRSYETYATGYSYTTAKRRWARDQYVPPGHDLRDERLSPLFGRDLHALPATTIITAELDPLRGEAEALAKKLIEAGVPVSYTCFAGVMHGFFSQSGRLRQGKAALSHLCACLAIAKDALRYDAPHRVARA